MGTEISDEDIQNIINLCDQIIDMTNYRQQLYDYLKNRMMAIAPNLTILVGDLVGARLISHAGKIVLVQCQMFINQVVCRFFDKPCQTSGFDRTNFGRGKSVIQGTENQKRYP